MDTGKKIWCMHQDFKDAYNIKKISLNSFDN